MSDGAAIIVPDDDSNQTRALLLLEQEGLIELPADASVDSGVTILEIVDDHGYKIQAAQADAVPSLLKNSEDGAIAVINYNYALGAGLKTTDALHCSSKGKEPRQPAPPESCSHDHLQCPGL